MIPWSCPQEETLILLVPAQALPTRIQIPYPHFQGYAGHRTAMHPGSAAWHAGGGKQPAITEGPDICVSAKGHAASHPSRQPRACRMAAGGLWDTVGGRNGPCDTAGYGLANLTLANFNVDGISSYTLHSKCKFASYWTGVNYTGHKRSGRKGNAPFVGAIWNDDLHSMRTWA